MSLTVTDPGTIDRLRAVFERTVRPLILTHDNPDPDALASAFALRALIHHLTGTNATIAFSGMIGRAENRAMVRGLGIAPEPLSTLDLSTYDALALVDAQPGTGNSSLPQDCALVAVIDHHPLRFDPEPVSFVDVREHYGATATMLTEYAVTANLALDSTVATALFYAIKSETQDLGREASQADRSAYLGLLTQADMRLVARIHRARVSRQYFRAYHDAIERAEIVGKVVITDLGVVASPDMVAEIADFLLRLRGTDWSCCLGRHHDTVAVSLRTTDPNAHAGRIIRSVTRELGSAGGHGAMAGGQIPLAGSTYEDTVAEIRSRLLEQLGEPDSGGEPLV